MIRIKKHKKYTHIYINSICSVDRFISEIDKDHPELPFKIHSSDVMRSNLNSLWSNRDNDSKIKITNKLTEMYGDETKITFSWSGEIITVSVGKPNKCQKCGKPLQAGSCSFISVPGGRLKFCGCTCRGKWEKETIAEIAIESDFVMEAKLYLYSENMKDISDPDTDDVLLIARITYMTSWAGGDPRYRTQVMTINRETREFIDIKSKVVKFSNGDEIIDSLIEKLNG